MKPLGAFERKTKGWCVVSALAVLVFGCDAGSFSEVPPTTCVESGALCDLGGGPLGVCERKRCSPGITEPCFHCSPQH